MHRLLDYILWLPLLGALAVLFVPSSKKNLIRWTALVTTLGTFVLTVLLYLGFDQSVPGMQTQYSVKFPWIEQFNIFYSLGVDGISLPMIMLTGLLCFLCVLSSWTIEKSLKSIS